jgi:hypothetical protein
MYRTALMLLFAVPEEAQFRPGSDIEDTAPRV